MGNSRPIEERFSEKVMPIESGCHEWQGCIMPNGYGQVRHNGKTAYAHRVAWELANGSTCGLYVLHRCDNRRCVNADHLFLGTFNDNMRDMVNKSRHAFGDKNGRRTLNSTQVLEIRASIENQEKMAAKYNVSRVTISDIRRRKSWRHI